MKKKKRKLKITVGAHSGFCFGVQRAYDLACVNSKNCSPIYILGKLVHNDDVCRNLEKRGIKEAKSLESLKEGTIIFTAHGVGPKLYEKANQRGMKIIDTTCPKVMKAQRLAKNYAEKKWEIIIFGDKKHKEVKGIKEWSGNKAKIISGFEEVKRLKLSKRKKYLLLSQTTQNVAEFRKIKDYLSKKLPHFVYFNTICDSTDKRQNEIRKLARENEIVIVVGGRDSANTRRLFEIARSLNPKSYFVENESQLKKNWFNGIEKVAISAGASTPKWVIKKVENKIALFRV